MGLYPLLAIGAGASLGAWLRWFFSLWLNPTFLKLPLGTLLANLVGGYLIGLMMVWVARQPGLSVNIQLFIVTGFLGGLTTFSTFSAETVDLFMRQHYFWVAAIIFVHVVGSISMTFLGIFTMKSLS